MIIENLWDSFCCDSFGSQGPVVSVANPDMAKTTIKLHTPLASKTVDEEINVLARHLGGIQSGQRIQLTLREILEIIPHKRRRSDSYSSLIKKLRADYDVSLEIVASKENKE